MTTLTLVIGAILVLTGVIAYIASSAASVTALIPAFVGIALLVAGLIARRPAAHRHAIHAALAVALLGALGSLMNVVKLGDLIAGTAARPGAVITSTVMFVLLVGYVVMGVRSFIAARRSA
ncbi:hypothetical protein H7J77_09570 [Mycolicibacillus parakoreensis]|uniref:Uncharacterized protein n=1 Tax=Mycolicibacillus parakoreensis TaxID=1069221 RepID=A0ABY3TVP4_9MYCO|nr:hypothetical protein [Mycolicibacillus parakoreensis]MCV7315787.1 hypothetical protein [Mycolicibacillus parakoreensis]ULN51787.1 hypothetical protein MIU77_12920 [Mycolicibacillus parakoreensis]HLR99420.1 hypothetical protein [Mycolicibacillus parakoreensis]